MMVTQHRVVITVFLVILGLLVISILPAPIRQHGEYIVIAIVVLAILEYLIVWVGWIPPLALPSTRFMWFVAFCVAVILVLTYRAEIQTWAQTHATFVESEPAMTPPTAAVPDTVTTTPTGIDVSGPARKAWDTFSVWLTALLLAAPAWLLLIALLFLLGGVIKWGLIYFPVGIVVALLILIGGLWLLTKWSSSPGLASRYDASCTGTKQEVFIGYTPTQVNPAGSCGPDIWHEGHCIYVRRALSTGDSTRYKHCSGKLPKDVEWVWTADEPFIGAVALAQPRYNF